MGMRLEKSFDYAKQNGCLAAQMRPAMKFGMASNKAAEVPDTPDQLSKAQALCQEILGDPNVPGF